MSDKTHSEVKLDETGKLELGVDHVKIVNPFKLMSACFNANSFLLFYLTLIASGVITGITIYCFIDWVPPPPKGIRVMVICFIIYLSINIKSHKEGWV